MDDSGSKTPLACPACRVIDRADGVEDGKLYKSEHYPVGNERRIVARIKRTEDHVADRVTAFAGSLNFVYIHTAWFAIWIAINVGLLGAALKFDEFPFGLLTCSFPSGSRIESHRLQPDLQATAPISNGHRPAL